MISCLKRGYQGVEVGLACIRIWSEEHPGGFRDAQKSMVENGNIVRRIRIVFGKFPLGVGSDAPGSATL
jgi:hypothetical protein